MRMIHLGGSEVRTSIGVEVGPAFEFLISLAAMGSPDEWPALDLGPAPFQQVEASLPPEFTTAWGRLGRRAGKMWLNLLPLANEGGPSYPVSGLVSALRRLSGTELRRWLLGYYLSAQSTGVDRDLIDRAVKGDRASSEALLRARTYFDGEPDRLADLLSLDARTTKSAVAQVVQVWNEVFFRQHEQQFLPALRRDAAAKQLLLETTTPERAVELATGIVLEPMPGCSEIKLIPQFAFRPWNVFIQRGEVGLWCYPMADESLETDAEAPPRQLVRLVKAISDEKRLRILKALSAKDASLQELTESLGMPKSTVHHHLLALRAAGLVKMTSEPDIRYILRRDALSEPSALLKGFLQDLS